MQNVEITSAKTYWFFEFSAVDPVGIAIGPLYRGLLERYRFLNYPIPGQEMLAGGGPGLHYKFGEFNFNRKATVGINLSMYSDGLMAEASKSTDITDAFLDDLADWAIATFGFRDPRLFRTRVAHESFIYFTSDVELSNISPQLRAFTELLRERTGSPSEEPWAIGFQPDGGINSFSFERRVNSRFSEKQYFSKATVTTAKHIELLQVFEKMFS